MSTVTFSARARVVQAPGRNALSGVVGVLVGAGVGVASAVLAQIAPGPVSLLPHYAAPSVLLLVVLGASTSTPRRAAMTAAVCFLTFVVAYYVVVLVQFGAIPTLYAAAWAVAAVTACPLAAAAIRWARSCAGWPAAVVAAAAGALALSDGAVGNLVRIALGRVDRAFAQPVLAVADLVVVAAALVIIPRDVRSRWRALALLVPFAVVATYVGWAVHFGPGPYR